MKKREGAVRRFVQRNHLIKAYGNDESIRFFILGMRAMRGNGLFH